MGGVACHGIDCRTGCGETTGVEGQETVHLDTYRSGSSSKPVVPNQGSSAKVVDVLPVHSDEGHGCKDATEEPLEQLLADFELTAALVASQYKKTIHHPTADAELVQRADGLIRRCQQQLRRATFCKGRTWQGGDADQYWVNMHTGYQKRFRSLRDVVRQVQVETRILKSWRRHKSKSLGTQPPHLTDVALDIDAWTGIDVFELDAECGQPLTQVFMAIFTNRNLDLLCKCTDQDVLKYILALESKYLENPYHNRSHAADVTLAAYYFWSSLSSQRCMLDYYTEVDLLAIIFAAAIHDVAHPGVSNEFLVKTQDPLAVQYSDRSVLESFHAATAFSLMKDLGIQILDHKLVNPPADALKSRIVDMVLATDMARHKKVVDDMVAEVSGNENTQDIDKLVVEKHMLHMADIGHPLRPFKVHQQWSSLIRDEFLAQGDQETALGFQPGPLFDRAKAPSVAKSQLGFLNFVVMPTWKPLHQVLGPAGLCVEKCFRANLEAWEEMAAREEAESQRLPASPCRSMRSKRSTTIF